MTDFFKSAFSVLTGNVAGTENDFVGQTVELGQQKLRVRRVVAEGTVDIIRLNTHHHSSVLYLSVVKSKIIHEYHFLIIYVIFVHNFSYQVNFTYKVYISRRWCLEFDLPWYSFIISRVDRYNALSIK